MQSVYQRMLELVIWAGIARLPTPGWSISCPASHLWEVRLPQALQPAAWQRDEAGAHCKTSLHFPHVQGCFSAHSSFQSGEEERSVCLWLRQPWVRAQPPVSARMMWASNSSHCSTLTAQMQSWARPRRPSFPHDKPVLWATCFRGGHQAWVTHSPIVT